jgi:hypothetical protein
LLRAQGLVVDVVDLAVSCAMNGYGLGLGRVVAAGESGDAAHDPPPRSKTLNRRAGKPSRMDQQYLIA